MPELPDIEVFRRDAEAEALGQRIERVEVRDPELLDGASAEELDGALEGHALEATHRHGKVLLLRAGSGRWLVLRFGMTGALAVVARAAEEPRYARLVLAFEGGRRLVFSDRRRLGSAALADDPAGFARDHGLGVDAGAPALDRETFVGKLQGKRGVIKTALMDQELIAGIGNVYADEILFQAGIDPRRAVADLPRSALEALHATLRRVLDEAVAHGAEPARMPEGWLLPRRAPGAACPRCGGPLDRPKVGGRTTYVCPRCQNGNVES